MTANNTNTDAAAKTGAENTAEEPKKVDWTKKLGQNIHLEKAKKLFGANRALRAMHAVAAAGGHGVFRDDDFKNPFFGGLQIPQGADHADTRSKINTALNNLK